MSTPFSAIGVIMQIKEQQEKKTERYKEIDNKFQETSFEKIIEIQRWMLKSKQYQLLKTKDNKLFFFDSFCRIWIEEKKRMLCVEEEKDIFWRTQSIEEIESKYYDILFAILRVENNVIKQDIQQGIDKIIEEEISGIAIGYILMVESKCKKENVISISQLLAQKNEYIKAIELLQYAQSCIFQDDDFILAEADCWITIRQWNQSLNCLKKISNPDRDILEIIHNIERINENEKL